MAATDIKYFTFENLNAPQLKNAYGSMIEVLDACLVTGLALPQVAGIAFTDGMATISFNTAHKLNQYQVIEITGANVAELNTQHRLLSVTPTTATFKTSVVSAGGTFIARLSALGWEKAFSSSNANGGGKAAYRSKNTLLPSRPFLRVVDELDPAYTATYAKYAKVGIVEDMTDINTMIGVQAPYDSAEVNKNWDGVGSGTAVYNGWSRWYYAGRGAANQPINDINAPVDGDRNWVLVGGSDFFYILPATIPSNTVRLLYGFGYFTSLLNSDASSTFLGSCYYYNTASFNQYKSIFCGLGGNSALEHKILTQRGYAQSAAHAVATSVSLLSSVSSGYENRVGAPGLANKVVFAPVFLNETVLRGELPSIRWLYQSQPYLDRQTFELNGRCHISLQIAPNSGYMGAVVFDLGSL